MKSKHKIIIIEDEQSIRNMLKYALELAGYLIEEASDAKQAFSLIQHSLPDLIILDWMLPSMSGIDIIHQLKRDRQTRNIPIIMHLLILASKRVKKAYYKRNITDMCTY